MKQCLLKNANIIDGTGKPAFKGHILVKGMRIESILKDNDLPSSVDKVIDVSGNTVSPGFIDMHSHLDWVMPHADHAELTKCFLEQGVTTVVAGNCGASPAPYRKHLGEEWAKLFLFPGCRKFYTSWESMGEFLDYLSQAKPSLNIAQLVGHATVHHIASDKRQKKLSSRQMKTSLLEVQKAFDEGACGLSLGLGYDPGIFMSLKEIEAFCRLASNAGKPVAVHLKAYSILSPAYSPTYLKSHNLRALNEMINIARKTGVKLQISHLLFVGLRSWRTVDSFLEIIDSAKKEGIDIMFDAFPYTYFNTTVNVVLPSWFLARLPKAYKNPLLFLRLYTELLVGFSLVGFNFKDFQLIHDATTSNTHEGKRISEIAKELNLSPLRTMLEISRKSKGCASILFHGANGEPGNEKVLDQILSHSLCLFETDALIYKKEYHNPAALGTFPKILGKYVRDKKLFSAENAIKRMTSLSAERFGLKDRGKIIPGAFADIVIWNPHTIAEQPPTDIKPAAQPKGIKHVFVNGEQVVCNGVSLMNKQVGQVLRI
jgi:N-acyl-D-amino-acid deacylase